MDGGVARQMLGSRRGASGRRARRAALVLPVQGKRQGRGRAAGAQGEDRLDRGRAFGTGGVGFPPDR